MRIGLVFGTGVLGAMCAVNVSVAQFAGERTPQLPGGLQPSGPVAVPPGGTQPVVRASYPTQPTQPAAPHPWVIKPENGPWMIMVRGYVGPESRKLAELLCKEIREKHKVASYIFERNAVERKAEQDLQEAIRRKAEEDSQPFLRTIEQARKKAEQDGTTFIPTAPRIKVPKPLNPLPEQWAVLIGGFADADSARKALTTVKKFPAPADTQLLDQEFITHPSEKNPKMERAFINPYAAAMVVPNPTHPSANPDRTKLEPFIVEMNKDIPNSLLSVRKPWTLLVKSFSTPMKMTTRDSSDGNVFDKVGSMFSKKNNMLDLTAAQANKFVDALRDPKMKPHPMDAFILHHRTGSLVTIGQFDAPDDPELLKLQALLRGMTFKIEDEKTKQVTTERMFDSVSPFPVPKQ